MSKTKENILEQSLKLFNKKGVSNVSLRTIANELDISVGNLQYHFKKREDIIETLYFQLVDKIDQVVDIQIEDLFESFMEIPAHMFQLLYEHRFFLLDFVTITRNNQKIKKHYAQLSIRREQEFLALVNILVEHDFLREEKLKNEYKSFFKRVEVLSNFWFSSILIQKNSLSKASIDDYMHHVNYGLYPFLTDKSRPQFEKKYGDHML